MIFLYAPKNLLRRLKKSFLSSCPRIARISTDFAALRHFPLGVRGNYSEKIKVKSENLKLTIGKKVYLCISYFMFHVL